VLEGLAEGDRVLLPVPEERSDGGRRGSGNFLRF
jgi:hypothetical protein